MKPGQRHPLEAGLIKDRIARHNIDCDLAWGYLHTIPKPGQFDGLKAWKAELD